MLQNLTVAINADPSGLNRGVSGALAQLNRLGNQSGVVGNQIRAGMSSPISTLSGLAGGFVGVSAALATVKQGLGVVSDFQRTNASLRAVSSTASEYGYIQAFLQGTADRLGQSNETLAATYKGLQAASRGTALEGAETQRIFQSVVRAGSTLQLSNDQVTGTLLALQQMMSKGTVQAEELRGQLGERLPGAFNLMAKALGVTTPQLNKMLEQGQVLASDALPKLATELERTFGAGAQNNIDMMAGGWTRATNQLKLYIAEFAETNGIDRFFAKIANGTADAIAAMREGQRTGKGGVYSGIVSAFNTSQGRVLDNAARMRAEFPTLPIDQQRARLELLQAQIAKTQDQYSKSVYSPLLEDLRKLYQQNRRSGRSAAGAAATEPFFDLERDKKKLETLRTTIANLRGNKKDYSKEQREFDVLTARIEANTASTRRNTAAHVAAEPTITTNERLLRMYSQRMRELGDAAPAALTRTVGLLQDAVDKERSAVKGAVDLGNALRQIQNPGASNARVGQILASNGASLNGLNGSTAAIGLPGLANYQMEQSGFMRDLQEQTRGKAQAIRAAMADIPAAFNSVRAEMNRLVESDPFNTKGLMDKVLGSADALSQAVQSAKGTMAGAFGDMLAGIGESIGQGQDAFASVIRGLISTIADAVIQIGKTLIATGLPLLAFPATAPLGTKQIITGGAIVLAGGLAKGLAAQAFSKKGGGMPAFAAGGTLFGPTVGLMGEYPGANRNPEFVAPVNKGAGLIAEQLMQMGGFGGGKLEGEFVLRGPDLVLAYRRAGTTTLNFGS